MLVRVGSPIPRGVVWNMEESCPLGGVSLGSYGHGALSRWAGCMLHVAAQWHAWHGASRR